MPPQTLNQLEAHPGFASFTYEEQRDLRDMFFRDVMLPQAQAQGLSRDEILQVRNMTLYRDPVFEDPQAWQPMVESIKAIPPQPELPSQKGPPTATELYLLASRGTRRTLLARPLTWLAKRLGERTGLEALEKPYEMIFSKDAMKLEQWKDSFPAGESVRKALRGLTIGGEIYGAITDIITLQGLTTGISVLAGGEKLAVFTRFSKLARAGLIPFPKEALGALAKVVNLPKIMLVHSGTMGAYGATRAALYDILEKGTPKDADETRRFVSKVALNFGIWAGADMIWWTIAALAPALKAGIRGAKRAAGGIRNLKDVATVGQAKDLIARFRAFENLPPSTIANLPGPVKDRVEEGRVMYHLMENVSDITPGSDMDLMRRWWERGFSLKRISEEEFKLSLIASPEDSFTFSADDVYELTGNILLSPKLRLDNEAAKAGRIARFRALEKRKDTPGILFTPRISEDLPIIRFKAPEKRITNKIMQLIVDNKLPAMAPIDPTQGSLHEAHTVGDSLLARSYFEAFLTRQHKGIDLPKDTTYDQVVEAVSKLRESGILAFSGTAQRGIDPIQAWWTYSPDAADIDAYSHYANKRPMFNGLWESVTLPARELGQVPTQVNEALLPIPVSVRNYVTPNEADDIVQQGKAVPLRFEADEPVMKEIFEAGRRPVLGPERWLFHGGSGTNAIVTPGNVADQRLLKQIQDVIRKNQPGLSAKEVAHQAKSLLRAQGFDSIRYRNGSIEVFDPKAQVKFISERVNPYTGIWKYEPKPVPLEHLALRAAEGELVQMRRQISAKIPPEMKWSLEMQMKVLFHKDQKVTLPRVNVFARQYLRAHPAMEGLDIEDALKDLNIVVEEPLTGLYREFRAPGPTIAVLPETVATDEQKLEVVHRLVSALEGVIGLRAGKLAAPGTIPKAVRAFQKEARRNRFLPAGFLDYLVRDKLGGFVQRTGDRVALTIGGDELHYDNLNDYAHAVMRASMNYHILKRQLHDDYGLSLSTFKKAEETWFQVRGPTAARGRYKQMVTSPTIEGLMDKLEGAGINWEPVLPSSMGPRAVSIEPLPEGQTITWEHNMTLIRAETPEQAMRFLANFRKSAAKAEVARFPVGKNYIEFDKSSNAWTAVIVPTRDRVTFSSSKDAKAWAQKGWLEWDGLKWAAQRRYWRVGFSGRSGAFMLYTKGQAPRIIKTKEDFIKQLQKLPIPEWAPDLAPPIDDATQKLLGKFPDTTPDKEIFTLPKDPTPWPTHKISHMLLTKRNWFDTYGRQTGDWEWLKRFAQITPVRNATIAEDKDVVHILDTIFQPVLGRTNSKQRSGLFWYRQAEGKEAKDRVLEIFELDRDLAEKIDPLIQKFTDATFHRYGLDAQTYIDQYLTHILETGAKVPKLSRGALTFSQIRKGTMPAQLKSIYEIERLQETWIDLKDDIYGVLLQYSRTMARVKHLDPVYQEHKKAVQAHVQAGGNPVPSDNLLTVWGEVLGMPSSLFLERSREMFRDMMLKLDISAPKVKYVMDRVLVAPMSLTYLAFMSLRAWVGIFRNLTQNFVTLPWRGWTAPEIFDGLYSFVRAPRMKIQAMIDKGMMPEHLPIGWGEEVQTAKFWSKALEVGMFFIRHSDRVNRAWANFTVENVLNRALKKHGPSGNWEALFKDAHLTRYDPAIRDTVMKHIRDKRLDAAIDAYAQVVVDQAHYPYKAGTNPGVLTTGFWAHLYKGYGTWSWWYANNIYNSFTHGSWKEITASVIRAAIIAGALYTGFREVLKINAKNFLPWNSAYHTGGPMFKIVQRMIEVPGTDYRARQARAELLGEIPRTFVPFASFYRDMRKSAEAFDKGDRWEGIIRAIGAPYADETWFDLWD